MKSKTICLKLKRVAFFRQNYIKKAEHFIELNRRRIIAEYFCLKSINSNKFVFLKSNKLLLLVLPDFLFILFEKK